MIQKIIKYILCAPLLLLASCNVEIPGDIIQPKELEALLYDYHLVQAMSSEAEGGEYKRRLYADFVFNKHNVSKEHFDSAMMWYARNPKYLHSIYISLYDRLDAEVAQMTGEKRYADKQTNELNRDTVNLWSGEKIILLSSSALTARTTFAYEADTTYIVGDSISFGAVMHFVSPNKNPDATAHIALVVEYNDGTHASVGETVYNNGYYSLQLPRNTRAEIKKVSGHVYFAPKKDECDDRLLVGAISLMRIHPSLPVEE